MVDYDESDFLNDDYENTTKDDNPNFTAIRDREGVNKKELYEVVWFRDAFVKDYNIPKTKESFQKVEKLIRLSAASDTVMRKDLNKFVAENWNK